MEDKQNKRKKKKRDEFHDTDYCFDYRRIIDHVISDNQ